MEAVVGAECVEQVVKLRLEPRVVDGEGLEHTLLLLEGGVLVPVGIALPELDTRNMLIYTRYDKRCFKFEKKKNILPNMQIKLSFEGFQLHLPPLSSTSPLPLPHMTHLQQMHHRLNHLADVFALDGVEVAADVKVLDAFVTTYGGHHRSKVDLQTLRGRRG